MCLEDRSVLGPNAAGIDVGAREVFVAVPPGRDEHPVRVFATFTEDLECLADWLVQCGVTAVAQDYNPILRPALGPMLPLHSWIEAGHAEAAISVLSSNLHLPDRLRRRSLGDFDNLCIVRWKRR